MKNIFFTAILLCSLGWNGASLGQTPANPQVQSPRPAPPDTKLKTIGGSGPGALRAGEARSGATPVDSPVATPSIPAPELTRLDLKFPGGDPGDLVRAIEKAMGKPINVIIPTELRNTQLPSFEIKSATVPELFEALGNASRRHVVYARVGADQLTGRTVYQTGVSSYGFRTGDAQPSEDSIWYFYVEAPPVPPDRQPLKVVKFYNLSTYLEKYQVEDIITAVETGWELSGRGRDLPQLRFHEETKLLIAAGTHDQQAIIQEVLIQLSANISSRAGTSSAPARALAPTTPPAPSPQNE